MQVHVHPTAVVNGAGAYQSHIASLAASILPRVLVPSQGSGNYGETGSSAFYTIDELPSALLLPQQTELERTDIDLGHDRLAFYIDDVLSSTEADALAACAESILEINGHSRLAPGINTPPGMRVNMAAHWYPSHAAAPTFLGPLLERFRHLVPQSLDGLPLYPALSQKVAQFKYATGDRFNRHVDGLFPGQGCNEASDGIDAWDGVQSGMSVLFYLNDGQTDGLIGGETRLWTADGSRFVDVIPRKGRALFFRRGSVDAVLHAGLPVSGEVPKYMALINLAYGELKGTRPLS
mmetsp:Transcript_73695/g.146559  ORF Transcript_73695/g.146559 Transcript_73695/m.146559 type:complete len:293 (-) Transcript_73695:123-1001(-)